MTTPISSSLASTASISAPSVTQTSALDKDAFLKLLVAQLSHQDPLQPVQGTEFVTQLAQFTAVEQAVSQTQKLDAVSAQLTGISANESVSLIGKQVTVRGQSLVFDGSTPATANVKLSAPAAQVTVSVTDAQGKVIRTMKLGAEPAGALPISWDGRDDSGRSVAAGAYSFDVSAVTAQGASLGVSKDISGVVSRVSFDKGYPVVVLDSGASAPISQLVSAGAVPASP
jgi:flagellar basal-body rod modification protein FlgD